MTIKNHQVERFLKTSSPVTVKGFKEGLSDFRLTKTEWKVAKAKKNKYFLILITFVYDDYDYQIIENPYERYKNKIQQKLTNPTLYYSVRKGLI